MAMSYYWILCNEYMFIQRVYNMCNDIVYKKNEYNIVVM